MKRNTYTSEDRKQLEAFVGRRISQIQEDLLSPNSSRKSRGMAALARLRRAGSHDVAASPDTWLIEFYGFPPSLAGKDDAPSPAERSAHTAFVLYAIHQQSQTEPMHRFPGQGLGSAVRRLADQNPESLETPGQVPTRFAALGTASEFTEIAHYARMLINQLRSASPAISLDYGLLAGQLLDLQNPYRADWIRVQWGREFAGSAKAPASSDTNQPISTSTQKDA